MATMTIGMLSMMVQETEQEPVFMGPTLDDVEALQRANAVALAMDEADFVHTTLQAVQPMVDSGDLKAATEHMINSLRDRIGLRGHVAMEGIGFGNPLLQLSDIHCKHRLSGHHGHSQDHPGGHRRM